MLSEDKFPVFQVIIYSFDQFFLWHIMIDLILGLTKTERWKLLLDKFEATKENGSEKQIAEHGIPEKRNSGRVSRHQSRKVLG